MTFLKSSYLYTSNGRTRTFHHRWHLNGQIYECDSCLSSCDSGTCHSQHFTNENIHEQLMVTPKQQRQLDIITDKNIKTFILCCPQHSAANHAQEFLLDAGINVVPQLLRLLFTQARQLSLRVTFHVNLQRHEMIFSSSELSILHHYDIAESIDMVFSLLLAKIQRYVSLREVSYGTEYVVRRMRLHIERIGEACQGNQALPLQYRVKKACAEWAQLQQTDLMELWHPLPLSSSNNGTISSGSSQMRRSNESFGFHEDLSKIDEESRKSTKTTTAKRVKRSIYEYRQMLYKNVIAEAVMSVTNMDIKCIIAAYLKHLYSKDTTSLKLNVNLYVLKVCRNSRELFAAPYHLVRGGTKTYVETPSYVVLDDVVGNFRQLVAINDVLRFLRIDRMTSVLRCRRCTMEFTQQTHLALHRMLMCGHSFEIETMPPNCVEIYERSLPLDMVNGKWKIYGIIE